MFISGKDFRESLRAYKPSVYFNGRKVNSDYHQSFVACMHKP